MKLYTYTERSEYNSIEAQHLSKIKDQGRVIYILPRAKYI